MREALEGMACGLATKRMSDSALDDLKKLLERHAADRDLQAGMHYFQKPGDYDFHFRIIQESGNRRLIEMLCEDLYHLLRVYRYRSSERKGRAQEALDEHREILAAMCARDHELAEKKMRAHLAHARKAAEDEIETLEARSLKTA